MLYFILWIVFILVVILSIPIASTLEKRAQRAAMAARYGDEMDAAGEVEMVEQAEVAVESFGAAEAGDEFAASPEPAGEDFPAFDEEFK